MFTSDGMTEETGKGIVRVLRRMFLCYTATLKAAVPLSLHVETD
jgi:hypothetical protein